MNRSIEVRVMSNTPRYLVTAALLPLLLGGCSALDRLKNVGEQPALSAIETPTAQPGY
jgi:flagellar L-ring protein precursor FlgH